ncbi:MAG: HDIG domain-containing metalloprotein [Victivallales bacterium]
MFSFFQTFIAKRKMAQKGMVNTSRKVNRKESLYSRAMKNKPLCWTVTMLLVLAASVFSMMNQQRLPAVPHLVKDQVAAYTVYAVFDFQYEDRDKTNRAKAVALAKLPLFYRVDDKAAGQIKSELAALFREIRARKEAVEKKVPYPAPDTRTGKLVAALPLPDLVRLNQFADAPQLYHDLMEQVALAVDNGMIPVYDKENTPWTKPVRIIDAYDRVRESRQLKDIPTPPEAAAAIADRTLETFASADRAEVRKALVSLLETVLPVGGMKEDSEYTGEREKSALAQVLPAMREITKGQPVISKDSVVTPQDIEILETYAKILKERLAEISELEMAVRIVKAAATTLLMLLFCGIYLYHIHPDVLRSNSRIRMMGFVTITAILLNVLAYRMFGIFGEQESIPPWLTYIALPLGFAPMVLSSIYGMRSALFIGLFVSVIAAFSDKDSFHIILAGLLVSGVSSFAVRRCVNYRNFFISGFLAVSLTTLLVGLLFVWRDLGDSVRIVYPWVFIIPFITGLVTTGATQIMLYILEVCFDMTTNMSLLLYSDYNHPLLKRLQFEAPGTYHHSLIVSTLAEAAAKEIGANPLKARVSALFHDVGKLSHPDYFTENNNGESRHKDLMPKISALIILNHVKEGLELARKYKLKKLMRDAIQQHHGTDVVYYFYKQAKESGEPVDEHDFRYQGPTPMSKEVAILSLADACEAASRSLQKPSHGRIEELVTEIIIKRMRDHQLDTANLTFKELTVIKESFVKTLTSMLHARVAYPKEVVPDEDDLFVDAAARKATEQKGA